MSTFRAAWSGGLFAVAVLAAPLPSHAQAILSLDAANSFVRGSTSTIVLNLSVKAKAVSFHRLYVKVRCKELVDLTYTLPEEKDEKGKKAAPGKTVSVKREEILFEKEVAFVVDPEYAPGSHNTLKSQLEIPIQLPPTARGKLSQIKWEAEAQGDVVGKFWDATSGWQEVVVK
ncbi:MAG TPA: hypothetical protein VFR73_20330 [Hyphomicrobiaceae bacterium]|nr:hypothetical protein [Hyphomicrobiaceae bacterium]